MARTLTFLHTAPVNVATFDRLLREAGTEVEAQHVLEESLLDEARRTGLTPQLDARIHDVLERISAGGDVMLVCTCSTIGGAVERAAQDLSLPMVRVDRAMAERAIELGTRILVVAALASTLEPTRDLILDTAQRRGKQVEYAELLCDGAWSLFERGDIDAYNRAIAACIHESAGRADVIVLAQASMAGAAALCGDLGVPVLSSPEPGLDAALRAFREL